MGNCVSRSPQTISSSDQITFGTKMANKLKVVMFLGSVREGRLGLRVAKFMTTQLEQNGFEVTLFDPKEMEFPLLNKPVFFFGPERKGAPSNLLQAEEKVKAADAYVFVSAEYNHSIPPALSNMVDYFGSSCYGYKPSGLVTYSAGIFGGIRAAMQLRALTGEIGCLSVSNIFALPKVQDSLTEEGIPVAGDRHMVSGASKLITQLKWMAEAMKNHREKVGVPQ